MIQIWECGMTRSERRGFGKSGSTTIPACDPQNIAIEAKIAADDRAFLKACGIVPELGRP